MKAVLRTTCGHCGMHGLSLNVCLLTWVYIELLQTVAA